MPCNSDYMEANSREIEMIRVCANNQQGYTGATYFAWSVMNTINDIKEGKVGA